MTAACVLAFLSGLVALSYEILWYRTYSFVTAGRADAFALLLGAYLTGLSLGAAGVGALSRRVDPSRRDPALGFLLVAVLFSNAVSYLLAPGISLVSSAGIGWKATLPFVAIAAGGMGALFPMISHLSIPADGAAGARVSYLYLANIVGSTSGSLLTGFVLLDVLSFSATSALLAALGFAMAAVLLWGLQRPLPRRLVGVAILMVAAVAVEALRPALFDGFYERLQLKSAYARGYRFRRVLESRGGVVTVDDADRIYGGGIYDGAFNTSLRSEINHIERAYFLQAVHPAPKDVLMIGLSSGSWAAVVAAHPGVERLTVVEINPAYLKLLPEHPMVADLAKNPKVTIVIDDGRRWLQRNTDRRFDAVVANATFNWRANASNLLSSDFLRLVRSRLNPGGLYMYNSTSSPEVLRTAASEFPHVLQVMNFAIVSDSPLRYDLEDWAKKLAVYPVDQRPPFNPDLPADRDLIARTVRTMAPQIRDREAILNATQGARIITDDNMGTEWTTK